MKSQLFSVIKNNSSNYNIQFYYEDNNIIKGKINKTKEELEENLDKLMEEIEIGKKYKIYGDDYNITITPINNNADNDKSTYVNFTQCEEILRKKLNISENEILTILQIEIDKMNEKALTNQVEYAFSFIFYILLSIVLIITLV